MKRFKYIISFILCMVLTLVASSCGTSDVANETEITTESVTTSTDAALENSKEEHESKHIERQCDSYEEFATDEIICKPSFEKVRKLVEEKANEYDLQGTVLVGVGDEIVYTESFGKASQWDNIDNTNTTRYGMASLTKAFTAAGIMQLYEEGKLDINDKINKYFPDYGDGYRISILELMQMRSGIVDYLNDMDKYMTLPESKAIYEQFMDNEDYKGLDEYAWTREEMLGNLYNNKLKFTPDDHYEYCNTNYYLLGCIIEQVTGLTYEEYITENILKPCHMNFSNLKPLAKDAVSYIHNEGFVSSSYETLFSVGGIRSNVFDMFSWIRNLSKGNVVSKDSFAFMIDVDKVAKKDQIYYQKEQEKLKEEQGDDYEEPAYDPDFVPTYYGCGWMVKGNTIWHRGYIDGFANYISMDLDTDVTIIILTNTSEDKKVKHIDKLWKDISEAANALLKD